MAVESKSLKPFFIKTYRFNDITAEELEEFDKICKRNNRTMSEEIELKIKNTVKNHTTGNSQFKIDQWADNKDMRAVPAFNSTKEEWSRYVKITNLENFTALKVKHRELGKILQVSEKHLNRIFFTNNSYSESITEMGFSPDIIDKTCLEKSEEAFNKLCHEDNMKFFNENSKQEYLNKIGVEAYQ
jgi:hypothetical protein